MNFKKKVRSFFLMGGWKGMAMQKVKIREKNLKYVKKFKFFKNIIFWCLSSSKIIFGLFFIKTFIKRKFRKILK